MNANNKVATALIQLNAATAAMKEANRLLNEALGAPPAPADDAPDGDVKRGADAGQPEPESEWTERKGLKRFTVREVEDIARRIAREELYYAG